MRLPLRRTAPHAWRPMTDAEWDRLGPWVVAGRGRPPTDLRRCWDAIFWVACSRQPWHALPAELGRADSAHRALRRAARSGLLHRLMLIVSDDPVLGGWEALRWRVARSVRRVFRLLNLREIELVKALGLYDALPCAPEWLPRPHLSETLKFHAQFLRYPRLQRTLIPFLRAVHRLMEGDRRAWRLTA